MHEVHKYACLSHMVPLYKTNHMHDPSNGEFCSFFSFFLFICVYNCVFGIHKNKSTICHCMRPGHGHGHPLIFSLFIVVLASIENAQLVVFWWKFTMLFLQFSRFKFEIIKVKLLDGFGSALFFRCCYFNDDYDAGKKQNEWMHE